MRERRFPQQCECGGRTVERAPQQKKFIKTNMVLAIGGSSVLKKLQDSKDTVRLPANRSLICNGKIERDCMAAQNAAGCSRDVTKSRVLDSGAFEARRRAARSSCARDVGAI
jgi:hypothetical protein